MSCDVPVCHATKTAEHKYITNVDRQIEYGALQYQRTFLLRQRRRVESRLFSGSDKAKMTLAHSIASMPVTKQIERDTR